MWVHVCVCVYTQTTWQQAEIPPLMVLAHYPEVTAHAWPLPAWPPLGEQNMLGCGSHVLAANSPTSCPRSGERRWQRNGERERNIKRAKKVLASICHLLCSLPPLSRSLPVSHSYSLASWLFTPAQSQYWEQNTNWSSCSKLPPTSLWVKTWVICTSIKVEWGGFYMSDVNCPT